jgi:DNA-binding CsgD family transcriptional regulator
VLRRRNAWGEFVLRAYWLGPTDGEEQTPHVGITIERRVPRAIAVWRRLEALPLTAREKQFCLLATGEPARDDIAGTMGLSASTVITFRRSVFAKLGVHSRAGLIAALQPGG